MTDHTAAFMFNDAAAFGAGAEGHIVFVMQGLVAFAVILFEMVADGLGDGIGTRGDPVFAKTGWFMAADAD